MNKPPVARNKVTKIKWYADFSELIKDKNINIPNVIIFGGIIVNDNSEHQLCSVISTIKSQYKAANFPLKWCFEDLKRYYQSNNELRLYNKLNKEKNNWRNRIFKELKKIDFKFIISIIKCRAKSRKSLKKTKEKVIRFAFVMALQKYGFYVKNNHMKDAEVILDWPPGNKKQIFEIEYRNAFYEGDSAHYKQRYDCGALKELGFNDSVLFSSTNECSMLQISDLIVGAFRDLLVEALNNKSNLPGVNLLKKIKDKLYGAPKNLNYGISIPANGNSDQSFSNPIWKKIKEVFG